MGFPTSVLFPDLNLLLTQRLRAALDARPEAYAANVTVSITVPNPRDERMVLVRRAGGPRLDWPRERARVVFNVWADTEQNLNDLSQLTRALVVGMADGAPIVNARESAGPSRIYDDSEQPLVAFTVDLTVRGADLT